MARSGIAWTDEMVQRVSDETGCHVRSVIRVIAGLPVRGRTGTRVRDAVARVERGEIPGSDTTKREAE